MGERPDREPLLAVGKEKREVALWSERREGFGVGLMSSSSRRSFDFGQ